MSVEDNKDNDRREDLESWVKARNKQLHYQRAVLQRLERENRRRRLFLITLLIPLMSMMTSFSLLLIDDKKYFDKKQVQEDLRLIVENGGDLEAIKQAFQSQNTVNSIKMLVARKSDYYDVSVPLSSVLSDLRVNSFRENNKNILPLLNRVMAEYNQVNPFDKLVSNQKYYFENIRIKSGEGYINIGSDLNNIADELHHKNLLVEEYLGDSKMSFWISIIAVVISLIIGGYQIFSARPEALKKLFLDALNGFSGADGGSSNKANHDDR